MTKRELWQRELERAESFYPSDNRPETIRVCLARARLDAKREAIEVFITDSDCSCPGYDALEYLEASEFRCRSGAARRSGGQVNEK